MPSFIFLCLLKLCIHVLKDRHHNTRADLNPSGARCARRSSTQHALLWERELQLTLLARKTNGHNGLLASPRSCYTAGDTQAALYLAAVLSVLSSHCNGAGIHFLSPHNKSLEEQTVLEMNTRAFIRLQNSVYSIQYLFPNNRAKLNPKTKERPF